MTEPGISPWIIDLVRQAITETASLQLPTVAPGFRQATTDGRPMAIESDELVAVRAALEELKSDRPEQHEAVLQFINFQRCDISAAARGIIWLERKVDEVCGG